MTASTQVHEFKIAYEATTLHPFWIHTDARLYVLDITSITSGQYTKCSICIKLFFVDLYLFKSVGIFSLL